MYPKLVLKFASTGAKTLLRKLFDNEFITNKFEIYIPLNPPFLLSSCP